MRNSLLERNCSQPMLIIRNIVVLVFVVCAGFMVISASTATRKLSEARSYDNGWEADMGRLDLLSNALQNEPGLVGYIFIYGARRGYRNDVAKRMECMKNYMIQRRGLPADSLRVINGGYREDATVEIWVAPKGSPVAVPRPTVRPRNIQLKRGGARYTCSV